MKTSSVCIKAEHFPGSEISLVSCTGRKSEVLVGPETVLTPATADKLHVHYAENQKYCYAISESTENFAASQSIYTAFQPQPVLI